MAKFIRKTPFKAITIIWWQDAYTTDADSPKLEGNADDNLTVSVGVICEEDDKFVHLSHFYDGIGRVLDSPFTSIPKGMIRYRRIIRTR